MIKRQAADWEAACDKKRNALDGETSGMPDGVDKPILVGDLVGCHVPGMRGEKCASLPSILQVHTKYLYA